MGTGQEGPSCPVRSPAPRNPACLMKVYLRGERIRSSQIAGMTLAGNIPEGVVHTRRKDFKSNILPSWDPRFPGDPAPALPDGNGYSSEWQAVV